MNADMNEIVMQTILCIFVVLMIILIAGFIVGRIKESGKSFTINTTNDSMSENFDDQIDDKQRTNETENEESDHVLTTAKDIVKNKKHLNKIITMSISPKQGNMIDVVLIKDKVPIDYWIFEQIAKQNAITDKMTVYMTDLNNNTFSNQNLRDLIYEIKTTRTCDDTKHRILINWIFNHSRFTSAMSKRYRMYNLYQKYFPLPLEADDYDAPLLESSSANIAYGDYGSDTTLSKSNMSDIQGRNFLDIPKTAKIMCDDQLFVEQDRDFSLYCNGDYLQWNGQINGKSYSDTYTPIVARYYMIVLTDPKQIFSYTSDGLVIVSTDPSIIEGVNHKRFEYTAQNLTRNEYLFKGDNQSVPNNTIILLSNMIKNDHNISWRKISSRIDEKLSKLGELMIEEHMQESMIDGIQKMLVSDNIDLYQTFAIDVVIRTGEPFIYKITASPVFREYGSNVANELLSDMIDRSKVLLRI